MVTAEDDSNQLREPAVSWDYLEESTGGDQGFLRELVEQFWIDVDERLPLLQQAVTSFDPLVVQQLAHALAGSAGCLGAESLRHIALSIEAAARQSRSGQAQALWPQLETEVTRVRAAFSSLLV